MKGFILIFLLLGSVTVNAQNRNAQLIINQIKDEGEASIKLPDAATNELDAKASKFLRHSEFYKYPVVAGNGYLYILQDGYYKGINLLSKAADGFKSLLSFDIGALASAAFDSEVSAVLFYSAACEHAGISSVVWNSKPSIITKIRISVRGNGDYWL